MNSKNEALLRMSVFSSLMAIVPLVMGFIMSFMAEPFEQEIGYGQSILGYNRDFLVDGRWWFVGGMLLCLFMAFMSWNKLPRK